jgi:hypothetical protein
MSQKVALYLDNDFLSVIVAKLIHQFAELSRKQIEQYEEIQNLNFSDIKHKTLDMSLNCTFHEGLVNKAASIAGTSTVKFKERLKKEIEPSLAFLSEFYHYRRDEAGLNRLSAYSLDSKLAA